MSETNLVTLTQPMPGIWWLDAYLEAGKGARHMIVTKKEQSRFDFTQEEQERFASFKTIPD